VSYEVIDAGNGKIVKAWKDGVPFDENTIAQLCKTAQLPFIFKHIAAMPDAHLGSGSTIGTVMPTIGAVCPAAVGVDIGCGMFAQHLKITKSELIDRGLANVREAIEAAVPHGRTNDGGKGDRGAWGKIPAHIQKIWDLHFERGYRDLTMCHPGAQAMNSVAHLGTLGTGNHFIELAEDEDDRVWLVLHSGSRGMGNKIGSYFTGLAQAICDSFFITLPHRDLAYLPATTVEFKHYQTAVQLAQKFAWHNRIIMANAVIATLATQPIDEPVHCHHNYISWERHFGKEVMVTRKGAVRADKGMFGIIPGSMGARTYIVEGLGERESFCSCSHGAGRKMSRTEAEKTFTLADLERSTRGVECDKSEGVIDEAPGAYKDIEAVMAAQRDLVKPVVRMKQFVCVKGVGDKRRRGAK
jgi:tRNA-splicing ligase RtcB (3'-phosphate/5'-hydroxy nucleic acid ligase)